jgi:hypothetical protein
MQTYLNHAGDLSLTELPAGLRVGRLNVSGCKNLRHLPADLEAMQIDASGSGLVSLPTGLRVGTLDISNCTDLSVLPEGLNVDFLDVSGCVNLMGWPERMTIGVGRLRARGCDWLTALPQSLTDLAQLDVAGCRNLTQLPEGLRVSSWLDLADTGVTTLPASLQKTRLRWNGVMVEARVVFAPETLTGFDVLATANVEVRRVILERVGLERFVSDVRPEVLDRDTDPGGPRRLLRIPLRGDEDLMCLAVGCPSTGREYLLRVPPAMASCHQAAAWIAGFDNSAHYAPLAET